MLVHVSVVLASTKVAAAEQAAPPPVPKDEAAIWDDDEVSPSVPARPSTAPAAVAGETAAKGSSGGSVKPRQRKHAYEYFNQWDAYDVDGELTKLDDKKSAADADEAEDAPPPNDGLPPDMTAAMLAHHARTSPPPRLRLHGGFSIWYFTERDLLEKRFAHKRCSRFRL